jgi:hypothetical protein
MEARPKHSDENQTATATTTMQENIFNFSNFLLGTDVMSSAIDRRNHAAVTQRHALDLELPLPLMRAS